MNQGSGIRASGIVRIWEISIWMLMCPKADKGALVSAFPALLHYYRAEFTYLCGKVVGSRHKLVRLNHPNHLLFGACLCCGLQSQSPTDPHLYAYVGMDWYPRSFAVAPK